MPSSLGGPVAPGSTLGIEIESLYFLRPISCEHIKQKTQGKGLGLGAITAEGRARHVHIIGERRNRPNENGQSSRVLPARVHCYSCGW